MRKPHQSALPETSHQGAPGQASQRRSDPEALTRALHGAGAANVIASLWKVEDEATAALMQLFYHKLWTDKQSAIEALRQAQLAMYRNPDPKLLARLRSGQVRAANFFKEVGGFHPLRRGEMPVPL